MIAEAAVVVDPAFKIPVLGPSVAFGVRKRRVVAGRDIDYGLVVVRTDGIHLAVGVEI